MNPRAFILLGTIILSIGGLMGGAKTNKTVPINQLHLEESGRFSVHGNCLNKGDTIVLTDPTGSIEVAGRVRCWGDYGKAVIFKNGSFARLINFSLIAEVKSNRYKVLKTLNYPDGEYVQINIDGELEIVKLTPSYGMSNYVILTNRGYERL